LAKDPTKEALEEPKKLLSRLRHRLNQEYGAMAQDAVHLSTRQKLDRCLRHVMIFDAEWLEHLTPPVGSVDCATARDRIYRSVADVIRAVMFVESLSAVVVAPGVFPLGITPEGRIADPELPDRPVEITRPRHLVEYPPIP
jgi:hypothetical protein